MLVVYSLTIFLSATLLFLIQPMFARMVMPYFGGSPSVWNTSVLFYQAVLLLAYVYVNYVPNKIGRKNQIYLQLLLVLMPLLVLPIGIFPELLDSVEKSPVLSLLAILTLGLGLPFFLIATSSPLFQKWFELSGHKESQDPYFLYVASNLGSLLGLLSYPLLLEPFFSLKTQSLIWTGGYVLLIILTFFCAFITLKHMQQEEMVAYAIPQEETEAEAEPSLKIRLRWVLIAFMPSSLMLGVTSFFSAYTNTSPLPFFWILPLAIYLISFILTFAKKNPLTVERAVKHLPFLIFILSIFIALHVQDIGWLIPALHVLVFFLICIVCHGTLYRERPSAKYLTQFYLYLSIGGVLGGIFNAILAPFLFATIFEYPWVILVFCIFLSYDQIKARGLRFSVKDLIAPAIILMLVLAIFYLKTITQDIEVLKLVLLVSIMMSAFISTKMIRLSLTVAGIMAISAVFPYFQGDERYTERSFFGVSRVSMDPETGVVQLIHGNTLHGTEFIDPGKKGIPLTYYHATSPIGTFFGYATAEAKHWKIGVVGLGAGSLSAYAQPGQVWTYFEIDPTVIKIASDKQYFSFLDKAKPRVVLGDARVSIGKEEQESYDLLVMDAYSSDAIPLHLISKEAIQLYLAKLKADGIIAFHITNRILNLEPVLTTIAQNQGLQAFIFNDTSFAREDANKGKMPSIWYFIGKSQKSLQLLEKDPQFKKPLLHPAQPLWTDDYSSLIRQLRFMH